MTTDPAADALAAAHRLVPLVRELAREAERLRHVPSAMADELARAGLLQMMLPRDAGGPELTPLEAFYPVEVISAADGSIGWCTMLAAILAGFSGWLDPAVLRRMAGSPADLRLGGSIRPQGRARAVAGGFRVDGRWDFASGIHYARWVQCPCVVDGGPRVRTMWVPAESVRIIDTWDVVGLRGTGSHDFEVRDVFVPEEHAMSIADPPRQAGALYRARFFITWLWTVTVANSFGIARGAIDTFARLANEKATTTSTALLRDRAAVQTRAAQAEAVLQAARAYVIDAVGRLWSLVDSGADDLDRPLMQARLAITHGMHESARAVDLVYHAAGTNAVYTVNSLERCFRDIHVCVQHGAGLPQHFESAGKVLLGLRPAEPGW